MTDTTTLDPASTQGEKPRRSGALSTMKVAELQGLAASMGITGTAKMRKSDLVTAIKDRQSGGGTTRSAAAPEVPQVDERATQAPARTQEQTVQSSIAVDGAQQSDRRERRTRQSDRTDGVIGEVPQTQASEQREDVERREDLDRRDDVERGAQSRADRQQRVRQRTERTTRDDRQGDRLGDRQRNADERQDRADEDGADRGQDTRGDRQQGDRRQERSGQYDRGDRQQGDRQQERDGQSDRDRSDRNQENRADRQQDNRADRNQDNRADRQQGDRQQVDRQGGGYGADDDERGGRRRNRNRNRSRDKRGTTRPGGRDFAGDYDDAPALSEDDVLVPVAGILDVLDNYAFVRTSGYLPGPGDVYVPLGLVKKNGMRKGDAVTGAVKAVREDAQQNQRQKFNALVRLDTVNGMTPDEARKRVEFNKLTPLYPQQRLRLETEPHMLTTRVIDLVAPIGKGQRGLIVAPAKAGKTMVMQAIANAITTNNPECHLMVVLVDERPEEVTDMQRAVKGEVIASTFDRPAEDHTTVAELAIERAKRLVEMGHDVVVLLDSITKLARAFNLAAPTSGRILSGGVDAAALYPPKRFFGAARNIEHGGSLTILATALVETGSRMDEYIFEEFKGTGNMELKLDRGLANRRIFPAVDINNSGTRKEEILLSSEELKIMWKLRRVLAALDQQQGIELLIDRIKKTKSNIEFLMQVQQTSSIRVDADERD